MTAPPSKIIMTAPPSEESPAPEPTEAVQPPMTSSSQNLDDVTAAAAVNRSRTTSETKSFFAQVAAASDVVDEVSVKMSEVSIVATAPENAPVAAAAASKIHSVNLNNNVATTDEAAAIKPVEIAATLEMSAISQTPKRSTPILQDNPDYEPVSPTPLPETPKSLGSDEGKFNRFIVTFNP